MANFFDQFDGGDPPTRDGRPYVRIGGGGSPQDDYGKRISNIESAGSGGYQAVGPVDPKTGAQPRGKYQVMDFNIGPWSREALGRELTPQEFLSSPEAQEAVFKHKFGQYVNKYGPEGAARAWFAGEKGMNNHNAKDVLGTSVADYSRKFVGQGPLDASSVNRQPQPPAQKSANFFDQFDGEPAQAAFGDRFAGLEQPQNAKQLAPALRRTADIALVGPETTEQAVDTFGNEAANTAFLNIPRNIGAGVRSLARGTQFGQEYDYLKAQDEARARLNPKSAMGGTAAGIVGGALVMPGIGGAATATGRAAQAAATGALYAGAGEFIDSKDPLQAGKSAVIGGAAGAVLSPVADKVAGLFNRMKRSPADFIDNAGNLTPQARQAVIDAGVDPNVMQREIAGMFAEKGMNPAAAREAALKEFGIQATRGQATRNVSDQQFEQMAAKGGYGSGNQQRVNDAFDAQQRAAQTARGDIQGRLGGSAQYDDALEAASAVQSGLKREAGAAKQAASGAYDDAYSREGGINSVAFDAMSLRIRDRLTNGNNPVIIDETLTPAAAKALTFIDDASALRAPRNLADPNGMPDASGILEVSLRGAEQTRKKLLATAKAAATPEDARAVRNIIREYDDEILRAADDGLFSGSQAAIDKLKEARGLYRDYRQRFKSQGAGDDVGQAIQKIVERDATGAEVANLLFGKSAVGEKGVSVRLAERVKNVFGEQSDEFAAVKQGLWNRLTAKPEGTGEWGPKALGNRIAKMLNGDARELAASIYSPQERAQMMRFAKALDSLVPNPNATNPSGSAGSAWSVIKSQMNAQNGGTAALGLLGYSLGGWETAAAIGGLRLGKGLRGQMKDASRTKAALAGAPVEPMQRNSIQRGATPAVGIGSGLAAGQDYGQ